MDARWDSSKTGDWPAYNAIYFDLRSTTGGSTTEPGSVSATLPYWVKIVRSGNNFTSYVSSNGTTWTQIATSQSISMAQNVYIGLAVTSGSSSSLATATFDNVSFTGVAPFVVSVSPSVTTPGSSVTIAGSVFGDTQSSSTVTLNGTPPSSITSWSSSQIVAVVPGTMAGGTRPGGGGGDAFARNTNVMMAGADPVIRSLPPPSGAA